MPFSSVQFAAIEDAVNRLAAEAILAQPGGDEGLVPAYSLLAGLRELCVAQPTLHGPVVALQAELEQLLDAARPFDAAALGRLRTMVEWFPRAIVALRRGETPPPIGAKPVRSAATVAATPDGEAERLLELNLEENRDLLAEFHGETVDHLQQIEAALLALDQEPENPEALHSIFRSFHTIKGNAGFLGLAPMHTLAHEVESMLDLARHRKLRLNAAIITEILHSRDALQALTQQIAAALANRELPAQVVPVRHLIANIQRLAAPASQAATGVTSEGASTVELSRSEPPPSAAVPPPPVVSPAAAESTMPTPPAAASAPAMPAVRKPVPPAAGKLPGSGTVRVNTEKLDSLMDVVGELVIVQSQLVESARSDSSGAIHQRNVAQLGRITKELQSTAMSLRMIPIKPTFQKMERLARDLARDFGKKVAFSTSGEDTELDRTVVEEMGDPLVHMVRNALDHGLEPPAERRAAGKPELGSLDLKAYHEGSNIVIELRDDGRGIDPEKIYGKAVECGLITEGEQLTRDEIFALIFSPGFSTANRITAVSGRGVGMDVVKRNIEKLRGKIEIVSEVGRGSTFRLKLPLTLAIIDGLVVRVGGDRFILPSTSVHMALRPKRRNVSTVHGKGEVLDLRGRFIPIHRLDRRFGIPGDASDPWDGIVVIVESSGRFSALLVDEMVSKQEVVIKNLGAFMQNLPGIAGGAILGDGNIALILDPGSLLKAA